MSAELASLAEGDMVGQGAVMLMLENARPQCGCLL